MKAAERAALGVLLALGADMMGMNLMRQWVNVQISPHGELYDAAENEKAEEQVTTDGQKLSKKADDAEQGDIMSLVQAQGPKKKKKIDAHAKRNVGATRKDGSKAAQLKQSDSRRAVWEHPLVLGILLGLFLIGPDHLGTLMALSTLTSGVDSFQRGFYWGVGHSIGVVLLCPIFLLLEYVTANEVSREAWEYYGDIFIGTSMIAIGIYFLYYEDFYLEQRADGTYMAKGCRCHSHSQSPFHKEGSMPASLGTCMPCSPSTTIQGKVKPRQNKQQRASKSVTISSEEYDDGYSTTTWHLVRNSLLGVFQGLCCPMGMTAGTGFISRITATASKPMLAAFVLEFAIASGIGAGLTAFGWGFLTMRGSRTVISGRLLYIATCSVLLLFGVVWLVAHNYGVLDRIDFGDTIHYKLMPTVA